MIELIVTISLISIVAIFSFGRFVEVESFRANASANETLNNLKFIQQLAHQQRRNIYFNQNNDMLLFCYENVASLCPPNKTVLRDGRIITTGLPISNLNNNFFAANGRFNGDTVVFDFNRFQVVIHNGTGFIEKTQN